MTDRAQLMRWAADAIDHDSERVRRLACGNLVACLAVALERIDELERRLGELEPRPRLVAQTYQPNPRSKL